MNTKQILLSCALIAAPVVAQSSFTSPNGFLNTEGTHSSYGVGYYKEGRYQFVDGELRGSALALTSVAFRPDSRKHTSGTGMGRTFASCKVSMAEGDFGTIDRTFSTNYVGTPTVVFNGKMSWSTLTTITAKPAPWNSQLTFPLGKTFNYSGKQDLVTDFDMRGGALANGLTTWTGSRWVAYYVDAHRYANVVSGKVSSHPARVNQCADSSLNQRYGAYTGSRLSIYGPTYSRADLRNRVSYTVFSWYTAPRKPYIIAVSIEGNGTGTEIGARCNKLYVGFNSFYFSVRNLQAGANGNSGNLNFTVPYRSIFTGARVWAQTAYADSKTNRFSLTAASDVTVPAFPQDKKRAMIYTSRPGDVSGSWPSYGGLYNPITRYTTK